MIERKSNQIKGSLFGLFSGLFWGLDSVLLGLVLLSPVMMGLGSDATLAATFLHDGLSFIILFVLLIKMKNLKQFFKVLFSKSGLAIISAALLGGPIGMGTYIISINYLGASLSSAGSAIYPAIGALLAFVFLRRKMRKHSIIGLGIAMCAIALMGLGSIGNVDNAGIGLLFLMVCVFGWGSEAVIIDATLKEDVASEVALTIRQLTSFSVYSFVVVPLIGFNSLVSTISHPSFMVLITITALAGTISYLAYYKSIDMIGVTQAMGLNISYPAWAFLFEFIINGSFDYKTLILVVFVILGSIMSNDNPLEFLDIFKLKERKLSE